MWAQGNQWNQMPLDAAAYQNMRHDLVDWATLAQQWIQMKEVHETVVLNVPGMVQNHYSNIIRPVPHLPPQANFYTDCGVIAGEAPMDVEKDDEITPVAQDWMWSVLPTHQPHQSWPQPQQMLGPRISHQVGLPTPPNFAPVAPTQAIHTGIPPAMNFPPRIPLLPLPSVTGSSDEDSLGATSFAAMSALDAAKRKTLPIWIREGLEKMEREKQKKEEREKFLQERDLRRQRDLEMRALQTDPNVIRSRFDDSDDEDESDSDVEAQPTIQPISETVSNARESLEDMMVRIRQLMTEILLEVTTEEIRAVAAEVCQLAKVKSRQVQSSLSSKSLTFKLGLDYGSGSDSEDDGEQVEPQQADELSKNIPEDQSSQNKNLQHTEIEVERDRRGANIDKDLSQRRNSLVEIAPEVANEEIRVLKDGTKVETDISGKLPHGLEKPVAAAVDATVKSDTEKKIRNSRSSSRSRRVGRSSRGSPDRKKRSRSRDRRTRRRSRSRSKGRKRSRSRSRERRRRSRSRDRRRSKSGDRRKSSSRKVRRSRSRSRDRRTHRS